MPYIDKYLKYFVFTLIFYSNILHSKILHDLPPAQVFKSSKELSNLIDAYHTQEYCENYLMQRIELLNKIVDKLNLSSDSNKQPLLKLIENKKSYLLKLFNFYNNYDDSSILDVESTNKDQLIYLNNEIKYDGSHQRLFGLYKLEAVDPWHRDLLAYYLDWQKKRPDIKFFLYLESMPNAANQERVRYIPDYELKAYHTAKIINKRLLLNEKTNNKYYYPHSKDGKDIYLFIIDTNYNFLIVRSAQGIHHTSLSHAKAVRGVGNLVLSMGKIVRIDFKSGHYQPNAHHIKNIKKIFRQLQLVQLGGVFR